MTIDVNRYPMLSGLAAKYDAGRLDADARVHLENFALDERPADALVGLYGQKAGLAPIADGDEWNDRHQDYVVVELNLGETDAREPATFRPDNADNHVTGVDKHLGLVRVEDASWPCARMGCSAVELEAQLNKRDQGTAAERQAVDDFLSEFSRHWNEARDRRPVFATWWPEVDDILDATPAPTDWAEQLRDRLGLGHYSPWSRNDPIAVLVMRYTVQEVLAGSPGPAFAVPTVLDSGLSLFFFPTPIPASGFELAYPGGGTLNLTPVATQDDYELGSEVLHRAFDYRPEHFFRVGHIAEPVRVDVDVVRAAHLAWIPAVTGRSDFGAWLAGGATP